MKFNIKTVTLIILIILIISIVLWNIFYPKKLEGFISFEYEKAGQLVWLPQYTTKTEKTIFSIYDNIFFDHKNGNLIEVDSSRKTSTGVIDRSGISITNIYIAARNGRSSTTIPSQGTSAGAVVPFDTLEGLKNNLEPIYDYFSYSTKGTNTKPYQVFYISSGTRTYLHVIELNGYEYSGRFRNTAARENFHKPDKNIITYLFDSNNLTATKSYPTVNSLPERSIDARVLNADISNKNTFVDSVYQDGKYSLYQITPFVKYDYKNGNILIWNNSPKKEKYTIYNRTSSTMMTAGQKMDNGIAANTPLSSSFFTDNNKGIVIVLAYNTQTVISIINLDASNGKYSISYCVQFNEDGVVTTTSTPTSTSTTDPSGNNRNTSTTDPSGTTNPCSKVCNDDLSCKWYWYFHTLGGGDTSDMCTGDNKYFNEDYLLKTEISPTDFDDKDSFDESVSDTEEEKDSSGNCLKDSSGNCLKDSSGNCLKDSSGNRLTQPPVNVATQPPVNVATQPPGTTTWSSVYGDGKFSSNANPDTSGGSSVLMTYATVAGIEGLAKTAGNVVNKTVDTAGNIVYKITDAAGNVVNRTFDTAGKLIDGSVDLVKGAGGGIFDLLKSQPGSSVNSTSGLGGVSSWQNPSSRVMAVGAQNENNSIYGPGSMKDSEFGNMPGSKTPVDNYSYFGALQSKGANYMPISSDFSSFRK